MNFFRKLKNNPLSSEVLTQHLIQRNHPHWTSYFVKYKDVIDDHRGLSHYNWKVGQSNYHILRTGCYPFIKFHCTKRPHEDLSLENRLLKFMKVVNFGIRCLAYGIGAVFLISEKEEIMTKNGKVFIHFLYLENKDSRF